MFRCKLTRITSTNNNFRTTDVIGQCNDYPTIGESFIMVAPPLEGGDIRYIETTPVQAVDKGHGDPGVLEFRTKNSHYKFEVIP